MPDTEIISPKWKFKTAGEVSSSPFVSGGVVYFGSCDNYLYAVDSKTGKKKWKFNIKEYGESLEKCSFVIILQTLDGKTNKILTNNTREANRPSCKIS